MYAKGKNKGQRTVLPVLSEGQLLGRWKTAKDPQEGGVGLSSGEGSSPVKRKTPEKLPKVGGGSEADCWQPNPCRPALGRRCVHGGPNPL
jgi:hypothetical protein